MRRRAIRITAASVVLLVIGFVAFYWFSLKAVTRSHVSRVSADLRSIGVALENYRAENGCYPPCTLDPQKSANAFAHGEGIFAIPTFRIRDESYQGLALTTPVAYLTSYFPDIYSTVKGSAPGYYTNKAGDVEGWVLFSAGPDIDYDFDWRDFDPTDPNPANRIRAKYGYDPSNGPLSNGDILLLKQ